jgi:hypothetical protein
MLLRRETLEAIESGRIRHVYRRWAVSRVLPGTRLRTAVGVVEVESVDEIDPVSLTADDAHAAGFESVPDLIAAAGDRGPILFRITVRLIGPDPRSALREEIPDEVALVEIRKRLERLDNVSRHGPWTKEILGLIAASPGVRAEDLARSVGREKMPFKLDVRKLKEMGLTESLTVGYQLSPRGEAVLTWLAGD